MLEHDADQEADSLRNRRAFVQQHTTHLPLHRRPPRLGPGGADRLSRAHPVGSKAVRIRLTNQSTSLVFQTTCGHERAEGLQL